MLCYIALLLLAYVVYYFANWYILFQRNIALAKRSGIPYIVVPVYFLNSVWLVSHPLWFKILRKLPKRYTEWVDFCLPDHAWHYTHDSFKRIGHDTYLTVAGGGICMWTAEAAVISQITSRRNDFPKPTHIYRSVNIYGPNVVSSEGQVWRHHRKATSPPFTEKNNQLVWTETIDQARAMLASWVGSDGKGNATVDRIMDDTMRLSLHVISNAGFGRKIQWPTEGERELVNETYEDTSKIKNESDRVEAGHSMSYTYAIHCLLDNILFQFLLPRWTLKYSPLPIMRKANEAFEEFGTYMKGMVTDRKRKYEEGSAEAEQADILAQLVKSQMAGQDTKGSQYLTDPEILGNMFVIILAGHETAANSIHFSLLYLALHISSQRRLQEDLDHIFQGRPPTEWDYDQDLPALFGGMAGAVLAEELRLIPPVINIPKSTIGVSDQSIMVEGKKCTVPANSYISVSTASVHRNPQYWPTDQAPTYPGGHPVHRVANLDNDLEEFRPERWIMNHPARQDGTCDPQRTKGGMEENLDTEGIGVNLSADTSEHLFKPVKGAYLPFSDGYRSCLGRRFAQVEVLAVLAVIFQNYSVELAVDKWASDEQLDAMTSDEQAEVWQSAAEQCRNLMMYGCGVIITLQMRRGTVKLRFVPRGQERFGVDVDEVGKRKRLTREGKKGVPGEWNREEGWRVWEKDQLGIVGREMEAAEGKR